MRPEQTSDDAFVHVVGATEPSLAAKMKESRRERSCIVPTDFIAYEQQ